MTTYLQRSGIRKPAVTSLLTLTLAATFADGAYITRQLTVTSGKVEDHLRISGSRAVWQRKFGTDYEIFLHDGGSVVQLTNNGTDDTNPEISGDRVVYLGAAGVQCYQISSGTTTSLTDASLARWDPRIAEDWAYWFEWDAADANVELIRTNLVTGARVNVSDNTLKNNHNSESNLTVLGNRAAWIAWNGTSSEILFNDGTTTLTLGATPGVTYFDACVTESHVVWLESSGAGNFIAVYDGSAISRLDATINPPDDLRAGPSGICLSRSMPGTTSGSTQLDTFMLDPETLTLTTIANGPTHEQRAEMGDGIIVWAQDTTDGSDAYIMVHDLDLNTTEDVSLPPWIDQSPVVSGRNVAWRGYDFNVSGETEVFIAYWLGEGAMLAGVDLSGEDLTDILFTGADLRGADLTGATLAAGALAGARIDAHTLFPDGADFTATSHDLTGIELPSAFRDWITSLGLEGADGGTDSDGDGQCNLLEFALGGNAADPASLPTMRSLMADSDLDGTPEYQLVFAARRAADFTAVGSGALGADIDGISYRVEGAGNLTDYYEDLVFIGRADTAPAGLALPDLSGGDWEYVSFRFSTPPGSGNGFMRVRVTHEP